MLLNTNTSSLSAFTPEDCLWMFNMLCFTVSCELVFVQPAHQIKCSYFPAESQMSSAGCVAAVWLSGWFRYRKHCGLVQNTFFSRHKQNLRWSDFPWKINCFCCFKIAWKRLLAFKKKHFDETETDGNVSRCPHTSGCPVGCNNTNIFLFFLHFCLFCVIIPKIFELFNGIINNDVLYEAEYQSAERCEWQFSSFVTLKDKYQSAGEKRVGLHPLETINVSNLRVKPSTHRLLSADVLLISVFWAVVARHAVWHQKLQRIYINA